MKIAIASSGLGHVARGIETWALDTAQALAGSGVDVALFAGGGRCNSQRSTSNAQVETHGVPCLQRGKRGARWLSVLTPAPLWRWGLKSAYGWEQFSFWLRLWPRLRRGGFDILHVQDPMVADWCRRFRRRGWLSTREILAHGTEESPAFLDRFDFLQHLAPWHLQHAEQEGGARVSRRPGWVSIPNFVDTDVFRPARDEAEKRRCREALGLPADALLIGCVAAVKKDHKRIDYLIREFAALPHTRTPTRPHLIIAGARQNDSADLVAWARQVAAGRVSVLLDQPRDRMPDLYRSLDIFVLSSLFEMMPIAVLEALASGLPVVANKHPVLEWMIGAEGSGPKLEERVQGAGGACIDMAGEGRLSRFLAAIDDQWLQACAVAARSRSVRMFSKESVIRQYQAYYQSVAAV